MKYAWLYLSDTKKPDLLYEGVNIFSKTPLERKIK